MSRFHFVASLVADLRPFVDGLNRELLSQGVEPVQKEELPEIDRMLHEGLEAEPVRGTNCPRCGGYVYGAWTTEQTCLNCGGPAGGSRELEDEMDRIARELIAQRCQKAKPDRTR